MSRQTRNLFLFGLLSLLLLLQLKTIFTNENGELYFNRPGENDFIAYHSSFQIFKRGENPYDVKNLEAEQLHAGRDPAHYTIRMWYPPWIFIILSPVLSLNYQLAAITWYLVSIVFIFLSGYFTWHSIKSPSKNLLPCLIASALFVPYSDVFAWGQMGLFFALAWSVFLCSVSRRWWYLAGAVLVIPATKPQIMVPLAVVLALWVLKDRVWKLALGFLLSSGLLTAVAEIICPGVTHYWVQNTSSPPTELATPTFSGMLRFYLFEHGAQTPVWPVWVFPAVGIIFALMFFLKYRGNIDWTSWFPLLMSVSLIFAPYALLHDFAILMIGQVLLVTRVFRLKNPRTCAKVLWALFGFQAATFLLATFVLRITVYYFWFPPIFLALWMWCDKALRRDEIASAVIE